MIELRHAGTALLIAVSILLCAARPPVRGEEQPPPAAKLASSSCQRSAFRVVLDVGHTLDVPGATSARGMPEYAFNLQLARDIREALVAAGFERTALLITTERPPRGLMARAARANSMAADLLLSIHHDSVPDYLLENWDYEGQQNHFSDRFKGFALFISNDSAARGASLLFGKLLGKALQARGMHYTPHYTLALMKHRRRELVDADAGVYRYDQLVVLRRTHMPAVLLEAGSIINRDEELEVATPERRSLTSAAVAAAVEEFCAARSHKTERIARRPLRPTAAALPPHAR